MNHQRIELSYRILNQEIPDCDIHDLIKNSDIRQVCKVSGNLRDICKGQTISYSRKVFINLINLCRDVCSYCTYKKEPSDRMVSMLDKSHVLRLAEQGKKLRCTEALIVTGERPEQKYDKVREWLNEQGHNSTIHYIDEISSMILKETGLLPHTNAGNLTFKELSLLKKTNVSIGCMLESGSERLMENGMPHEFAPSKNPRARLKVLENAGKLQLPITTGLLIGIGETMDEIIDSLFIIRDMNRKYGHIQEIIIQNFVPKFNTPMGKKLPPPIDYFVRAVCAARIILPEMNIQVPPNLNPNNFSMYIRAGINDWGGISPVTIDHVNPESPWPNLVTLKNVTQAEGYSLGARLPIYPEYIMHKREFIEENMWKYIVPLIEDNGFLREAHLN